MATFNKTGGQQQLKAAMQQSELCTNCGACVDLCPYNVAFNDRIVFLDPCDRDEGRCYAFCPRTPTDLSALYDGLFDAADLTPELGAVKGLYVTRAADPAIRDKAQHGGTVSALMALALKEGMIDSAVLAEDSGELEPRGTVVADADQVASHAGSKFVVSPTVAAFNRLAKGEAQAIGVVATPCQAMALAKMRLKPYAADASHIDKLKLVVGLFCGWALSLQKLAGILEPHLKGSEILKLDIPPSGHACMEVTTEQGMITIPLEEINPAIRPACSGCLDMTAEFADLSVGSARLDGGWEESQGWNQVLVRTEAGQKLMDLAKDAGALEFREAPAGAMDKLKQASMNKKRRALEHLAAQSGSEDDLIYLDPSDPLVIKLKQSWAAQ